MILSTTYFESTNLEGIRRYSTGTPSTTVVVVIAFLTLNVSAYVSVTNFVYV